MTTVAEILNVKGPAVHTVYARASVLEATRVMNDARIGSVVVKDDQGVAGILTERDLLTRVLAEQRDPRTTLVQDVMTREVLYCTPSTPIDDLRLLMQERRIRHVPVLNQGGRLAGLVSIGDVNALHTRTLAATVESLEAYITRG